MLIAGRGGKPPVGVGSSRDQTNHRQWSRSRRGLSGRKASEVPAQEPGGHVTRAAPFGGSAFGICGRVVVTQPGEVG